jgi:hypothetical protein
MAFTKNRDWDTDTDGDAPLASQRHAGKNPVVLDGPDGTYFGWEDADGSLFVGTRLTFDSAAQAERDAKTTAMADVQARATAREATFATLKAKREGGQQLNMTELNALADIVLGVDLSGS